MKLTLDAIRKQHFFILFVIISLSGVLTSCLTVEKKQYTYMIEDDNSGTLTIKYINIFSMMDNGVNVSEADFKELLETYIQGDQIYQDYPGAENIKTNLFEENGQLCGEVTLHFNDLNSARLYQFDRSCPIMMNISTNFDSETFQSSNGEYGNEHMPVVFWRQGSKKLIVTTSVTIPDESSVSLVNEFRKWQNIK